MFRLDEVEDFNWIGLILILIIFICPLISAFMSYGARYLSTHEGLIVAKKAFFPNGVPVYLLSHIFDQKKKQEVANKPSMYYEYYDSEGKIKYKAEPVNSTSKKPWYKVVVAEKNGREYELSVTENEFLRYKLGQYMKKRMFSQSWHPYNRYYSYRDYYWGSRYYYYRRYGYGDYYYGGGYYGSSHRSRYSRTSSFRRSSYGSGFRAK